MRFLVALALMLLAPLRAAAGDVVIDVRTSQGKPVADAVVTVAAPHAGPIHFPWPYRMAQQNIQFDPFVLIVPVGAEAMRAIRRFEREGGRAPTPILAVTANVMNHQLAEYREAGMDGVVAKPLQMGPLLSEIGRVLAEPPAEAALAP